VPLSNYGYAIHIYVSLTVQAVRAITVVGRSKVKAAFDKAAVHVLYNAHGVGGWVPILLLL